MGGYINGKPIYGGIESLKGLEYDEIIIASLTGYESIKAQLINSGISPLKINDSEVCVQVQARINFLRDFSKLYNNSDIKAVVAEGGVYQGDFAKEINRYFPNRDVYLFDTFEGFDSRDIKSDKVRGLSDSSKEAYLADTSVQTVLDKLPFADNAIIRKGFFPETARGLEDQKFLFVNLDFDLYDPILAGLQFFYPRMVKNGCILIHDYFSVGYKGVKEAISAFEKEHDNFIKFPVGDHISIAIMKK